MGRGCDDVTQPIIVQCADRRAGALAADRNFSWPQSIRAAWRAQRENVQNEPNCPQLAKRSGALRFCAIWRAARARSKIRRCQIFFHTGRPSMTRTASIAIVLAAASAAPAAIPAFPGAEGPGANATGGRGGDVYHVTNLDFDLNGTTPGSLKYGIVNAPAAGR